MKKLTRQELTDRVANLERIVTMQQNTIKVMDAGLFLTIYSLLHDKKIYTPEFIKSKQDIAGAGVSEAIDAMLDIIKRVEENDEKAEGVESKSD